METKCGAEYDGYRCQLSTHHSGNHKHYGTDAAPTWISWSDQGVEAAKKEQKMTDNEIKSRKHSMIKNPLHRQYARFFDRIGWFWEHEPTGLTVTPSFVVEFICGRSDCPPLHSLLVYVEPTLTTSSQLEERVYEIADQLQRCFSDTPEIAVFGAHPRLSFWFMACGGGGGNYTVDEKTNYTADTAWASAQI